MSSSQGLPSEPPWWSLPKAFLASWRRSLPATQLMCLAVAAFLFLLGVRGWTVVLYSLLIGNCIALFIHAQLFALGRWQAHRRGDAACPPDESRWPGWPWTVAAVVTGVLLGYTLGTALADWLTGTPRALGQGMGGTEWLRVLGMSLVPAVVGTLIFHWRARLQQARTEIAQAQRLAAETQLKLLESQLEPHMLFNTLANLRALIAVDPPRAQQMLDHLIAFLRATLAGSRQPMHPLSAEFQRLADYLALMQIRMGPRLSTTFQLPPDLASVPVPPLLLQPLVENAIKHGLEPQRGPGELQIRASRVAGAQLQLVVEDSGLGLAPAPTRPTPGGGFGLTQVRERLSTLYGPQASLALEPSPSGGTRATVQLPLPAMP